MIKNILPLDKIKPKILKQSHKEADIRINKAIDIIHDNIRKAIKYNLSGCLLKDTIDDCLGLRENQETTYLEDLKVLQQKLEESGYRVVKISIIGYTNTIMFGYEECSPICFNIIWWGDKELDDKFYIDLSHKGLNLSQKISKELCKYNVYFPHTE
jgi:hypothetical protein